MPKKQASTNDPAADLTVERLVACLRNAISRAKHLRATLPSRNTRRFPVNADEVQQELTIMIQEMKQGLKSG
jgi:hypothetical protein